MIDLPRVEDGTEEWVVADSALRMDSASPLSGAGVVVTDGVLHSGTDDKLSTMLTARMAGSADWNRIIETISAAEAGRETGTEIVVQPGGALVPVDRGHAGHQLSTVPEAVMAVAGRATRTDLQEARRHDPSNVEGWRFIDDEVIPGLQFSLAPAGQRFIFFCFRSPTVGGRWYLTVLHPNLDDLFGHEAHMIRVSMGAESIPIVCSAADSTHPDLARVRGAAAKFALYHTLRQNGHVPFSV